MLGMQEDGLSASSQWENYSSDMNWRLAQSLASAVVPPAATAVMGACPMSDWDAFYATGHAEFSSPADIVPPVATATVAAVADSLGRAFTTQLYDTGVDGQCFAAPRGPDPDNPSIRAALSGPESQDWQKAREKEYQNILPHVDEVSEDSLPTWDKFKQRAREVVGLVEVCKKKYIDNVFDKLKVRWAYDGAAQKRANATARVCV